MNAVLTIIYLLVLLFTIVRILLDTHSSSKTLAYLLLVILLPVVGIIFYFAVGINYRHGYANTALAKAQKQLDAEYLIRVADRTDDLLKTHHSQLGQYEQLVRFTKEVGQEHLSQNQFTLLINGEQKFPEVLLALEAAQHFIHMEYYAWENDVRGNQIKDILLKKAAAGIKVRVLYDDYASRKIKRNIVKELKRAGVEIFPKIKVKIKQLANRMNHRDHRKIIIVDGRQGFLGGINISDRYDNTIDTGLWWRDTHIKVTGPLVLSMQRHFIISWNASQPQTLNYSDELFTEAQNSHVPGNLPLAQVVAGGPVYPMSNIMLTYFKIFTLASKKLYITNPYFIPNESILDSLKQAALAGVDVRLMVPKQSDSLLVGLSANYYFEELLEAGVRIFLYKKGFVHAKTVVADENLSVVGTANMDIRSFDLNFEMMSIIYSEEFARKMENMFADDLNECDEIELQHWKNRSFFKKMLESIARLLSAFL
jgi:cardiolipin synthase